MEAIETTSASTEEMSASIKAIANDKTLQEALRYFILKVGRRPCGLARVKKVLDFDNPPEMAPYGWMTQLGMASVGLS